jgi:hypothetical protein
MGEIVSRPKARSKSVISYLGRRPTKKDSGYLIMAERINFDFTDRRVARGEHTGFNQ